MIKREHQTVGNSQYVKYQIGEIIRWPKNGTNLLKAVILEDRGHNWLVVDRFNKEHLAWKGCVQSL